jgi:exosortase
MGDIMTFAETWKRYPWAWLLATALLVVVYAPIFPRMAGDWMADPNYSHGFLVPAISAWFAWKALPEIKTMEAQPSSLGFLLIALGLGMLTFGMTVHELFTSRSSFIFILAGIIQLFFGTRVLKKLALPIGFLVFMIPLPYTMYNALALPLRSLVSYVATEGMQLCGLPVLREGNVIILPNITLEVVEACSGMRSLVSLMALGTAYAFLFLKGAWRQAALILATVPIAVATNVARVFITGMLSRRFGASVAEGFFHEFAGFAVFAVALVLTAATGWLLSKFSLTHKGANNAG